MSSVEEKDWPGSPEEASRHLESSTVPMKMQLFSSWEVRKVPNNCVPRLCTLTVTHLRILRSLESSPTTLVLAIAMKSPHRTLRSNELPLPLSGLIDITLELTYSLQYPHFLKRGGNELQLRLQRRKRYRNRPLGGYKSLASGSIDMSSVLQHSFQGPVNLYAEKFTDHVAEVTIGSLTSTAVEDGAPSNLAEGSSEEEDDDILFSDYLRGSDSDSGDNMEQQPFGQGKSKNRLKPSVLGFLRLSRPKDGQVELALAEAVGDRESGVTFASSISDSDEEEEEGLEVATPHRPILSPFFSSDRCSMVSLPITAKSAEAASLGGSVVQAETALSRKYGSLEQAIIEGQQVMDEQTTFVVGELVEGWEVERGRVWVVEREAVHRQSVVQAVEGSGDGVLTVCGFDNRDKLQLLLTTIANRWKGQEPFSVILYGGDELVAAALSASQYSDCPTTSFTFHIFSPVAGHMSSFLSSMDELYQTTFSPDNRWTNSLVDSIAPISNYIKEATHCHRLPVAQVTLQRPRSTTHSLPFVCAVSVGENDMDPSLLSSPAGGGSSESQELVIEHWRREGQKTSVKVKSMSVYISDAGLTVTTTSKDRKAKGIRIKKRETATFTASHLTCRPSVKQETMTVCVDGVEYETVLSVKVVWEHTPRTFPVALATDKMMT